MTDSRSPDVAHERLLWRKQTLKLEKSAAKTDPTGTLWEQANSGFLP